MVRLPDHLDHLDHQEVAGGPGAISCNCSQVDEPIKSDVEILKVCGSDNKDRTKGICRVLSILPLCWIIALIQDSSQRIDGTDVDCKGKKKKHLFSLFPENVLKFKTFFNSTINNYDCSIKETFFQKRYGLFFWKIL